jgi:hypothetical protein
MAMTDLETLDSDIREKEVKIIRVDDVEGSDRESTSPKFERETMSANLSSRYYGVSLKVRISGGVWTGEYSPSLDLCSHWR